MAENPLARIYRDGGSWSWAYLDVSGDVADPRGMASERRRSVRDELEAAGAPASDVDAIEDRLSESTGVPSPSSRFLLARDGGIELDEAVPGRLVAPESAGFGPVPDVLPLLMSTPTVFAYLTVEVGHDGGEVRLYRTDATGAAASDDVEGSTENIQRVQKGGWAQSRYQRHTEDVWQHNMDKVASTVDRLVERHHPRLLVVAGDSRAVGLLQDRLSAESRGILSTVDSNVRADGAADDSLQGALAAGLAAIREGDKTAALDHLNKRSGDDSAFGVGPVVTALQQAQADSLILDVEQLGDRTLHALASEPWIAAAPEDALDADDLGVVPAALALVRAALLTDATVVFASDGDLSTAPVAAALRWPTGPTTPGV